VSTELPELGAVFWPVGTGDSATIVVGDDVIVQVDLNDRDKADDDENPEVPVVDLLIESLPEVGGKRYLSAFVLTHADKDHCSGFADLNSKATIGELWATPRLWREYLNNPDTADDLCEDAQAFHKEVKRRVAAIKKAMTDGKPVADGNRVLVVGYDTDEAEHAYSDLPDEYLVYPGQSVTKIDGKDYAGRFEAFIHAPFKDDCAAARNDTSLSMQVTLTDDGGKDGKVLLLGDLAYETIMKIINYSEEKDREEYLAFDLLLAPHHCSKKVMYVREGVKEVLKTDVLEAFERHARTDAVVVASSAVIPASDTDGANPPHRKAADRYEDYVGRLICTMEWPSVEDPSPVVFGVDASGAKIVEDEVVELAAKTAEVAKAGTRRRLSEVAAAATAAGRFAAGRISVSQTASMTGPERVRAAVAVDRGTEQAPTTAVGFGRD
jgi:beta-lactamase superfamily II metal-dependent hydrolase